MTSVSCDDVYRERNALVSFVSRVYPSCLAKAPDAEEGFNWILYVQSPAGQLSWHISDNDLDMFGHLYRQEEQQWDGHTTAEKYDRLLALHPPYDNPF